MTAYPTICPSPAVGFAKRAFDVTAGLAGCGLFVLSYPVIALFIKLDSRGPVLYRQERVGYNARAGARRRGRNVVPFMERRRGMPERRERELGGKPFVLLKYRTMREDAELDGPRLCDKDGDERITRVGRWLRWFHFDELPQFTNVLRGEMSMIGPRPERPYFTRVYMREIPHYLERLRYVRPGLTGLAQITLGYDQSLQTVQHKFYYDVTYRLALSSLGSWIRMESWIVFNTVKYLLGQFGRARRSGAGSVGDSPHPKTVGMLPGLLVDHPLKLIEGINARRRLQAGEVPEFVRVYRRRFAGSSVS